MAALAALLTACGGCAWTNSKGERVHLVLGLGVITTTDNASKSDETTGPAPAATAQGVSAVGLLVGPGPGVNGVLIGWLRQQWVSSDPGGQSVVEVTTYSDGRTVYRVSSWPAMMRSGDSDEE